MFFTQTLSNTRVGRGGHPQNEQVKKLVKPRIYKNQNFVFRYPQLTHVGAFCNRNDLAFSYDSEVMPVILDEPVKPDSRKELSEEFKIWRQDRAKGEVNLVR